MDLQEAIRMRRTIHSFNQKIVSEATIARAVEMANYAPCHYLTFPWRFTLVSKKNRELIAELALEIKRNERQVDEAIKEKILGKILNPSHLLIASQILHKDLKFKLEDYAACCCAIQNLSLSLASDAVGSKWSTGKLTKDIRTYEIVDIDHLKEEIIGFIFVGYGNPPAKIKRPSIETIFRNTN